VLVAAGCHQAAQVQRGLTGAYDSAVDDGKHLRLPDVGDIGLDKLSSKAVHDELSKITALVPSGADAKSVIGTACDAKTRYESGTATTYDQAAAEALKAHGLNVSMTVIARIEQHLIHAAESSNPVPAAAAVFACRWAGTD
jgi:phage baseplate assembly protein gpV